MWSDHPRNRSWQTLRRTFIAYFANYGSTSRGAHDFGCSPSGAYDSSHATRSPDIHNSSCTMHGPDVPTLVATLFVPPSGKVGATGTTSTLAFPIGEGCTGGTSSQPSSDDHVGEARLSATG
jgi:hypothetical protein